MVEATAFLNQMMELDLTEDDIAMLETRNGRLGCRPAAGWTFSAGTYRCCRFYKFVYRLASFHIGLSP
jgi:hypothetical protein